MNEDFLLDVRNDRAKEKEKYRKKRKAERKERERKKEILGYSPYIGAYKPGGSHVRSLNLSLKFWKKVSNKSIRGERIDEKELLYQGAAYKRKKDLCMDYYW